MDTELPPNDGAIKGEATLPSCSTSPVPSSPKSDRATIETESRDRLDTRYTQLKCLYEFITTELGDVLELRKRVAEGTQKYIKFEDLWHLYAPGDIIYSNENGYHQLHKIYYASVNQFKGIASELEMFSTPKVRVKRTEQRLREERGRLGFQAEFEVDCYAMEFDGGHCGPVGACKSIQHYAASREITSLPIFPLAFHPRKDDIIKELTARGRRYLSTGHKYYDGRSVMLKRADSHVDIQSDVYIDLDTYYLDNTLEKPWLKELPSRGNMRTETGEMSRYSDGPYPPPRFGASDIESKLSMDFFRTNRVNLTPFKPFQDELSPECLCLMPHYVAGYVFQLREWRKYFTVYAIASRS